MQSGEGGAEVEALVRPVTSLPWSRVAPGQVLLVLLIPTPGFGNNNLLIAKNDDGK